MTPARVAPCTTTARVACRPAAGGPHVAAGADRLGRMEAQLERWSARIDRVAAKTEGAGAWVTIGEHHRIDELRVWRAIAQARFDAYRTAEPPERQGLRGGVEQAWNDLAVAMKKVKG